MKAHIPSDVSLNELDIYVIESAIELFCDVTHIEDIPDSLLAELQPPAKAALAKIKAKIEQLSSMESQALLFALAFALDGAELVLEEDSADESAIHSARLIETALKKVQGSLHRNHPHSANKDSP